jgi:hypothetical protein
MSRGSSSVAVKNSLPSLRLGWDGWDGLSGLSVRPAVVHTYILSEKTYKKSNVQPQSLGRAAGI